MTLPLTEEEEEEEVEKVGGGWWKVGGDVDYDTIEISL